MKLGTIVYDNEIYNLDYMNSEEIKSLLNRVEGAKRKNIADGKNSCYQEN